MLPILEGIAEINSGCCHSTEVSSQRGYDDSPIALKGAERALGGVGRGLLSFNRGFSYHIVCTMQIHLWNDKSQKNLVWDHPRS